MSELKPLGDYIGDNQNVETIGAQQLQEFRDQALEDFNKLTVLQKI